MIIIGGVKSTHINSVKKIMCQIVVHLPKRRDKESESKKANDLANKAHPNLPSLSPLCFLAFGQLFDE